MNTDEQMNIVSQFKYYKSQAQEEFENSLKNEKEIPFGFSLEQICTASIKSDFGSVKENTPEFWYLYDKAFEYNCIIRDLIKQSLTSGKIEMSEFDRLYLLMIIDVSKYYSFYYKSWLKTVLNEKVYTYITSQLNLDRDGFMDTVKELGFDNNYTVLIPKSGVEEVESIDDLESIPYAVYFKNDLAPIVSSFSSFIDKVKNMYLSEEQKIVIEHIRAYQDLLTEEKIKNLETKGARLDEIWMDNKYWIQLVHDIETDYADPLGCKIIPDFSVRFMDVHRDINEVEFGRIKDVLVEYYQDKSKTSAKRQIPALKNSDASLCYIPFSTAISHYFQFAGQSLPNRPDVREKKGVKIYLNYEQSRDRFEEAKKLFSKLFDNDKQYEQYFSNSVSMLYHVVPHEFGHTIYNISFFKNKIKPNLERLEELRADLNAYYVIYQYYEKNIFSVEDLYKNIVSLVAFELRRYTMWDSNAIYPYKISMLNLFHHLFDINIVQYTDSRFLIDLDKQKIISLLQRLKQDLDNISSYLDKGDNDSLNQFYDFVKSMQYDEKVQKILSILNS